MQLAQGSAGHFISLSQVALMHGTGRETKVWSQAQQHQELIGKADSWDPPQSC